MVYFKKYINQFGNNPFCYYLLFSFFGIFVPCIASLSNRLDVFQYLNNNTIVFQNKLWFDYTFGYLSTSIFLSYLYSNLKYTKNKINRVIFIFNFPIRFILKKILILKINNLKLTQIQSIILFFGTCLFIIQSLFAYYHHLNDEVVTYQFLSGRFYSNGPQNAIFYFGNVFSVLLSFSKKTYLKFVSIGALSLGLIGQALDLSRYSFISAFLIILVLFLNINFNFSEFFKKTFTELRLQKLPLIFILICLFMLLMALISIRNRMPILSFIAYLSGFSFYNIGTETAREVCIPDLSSLLVNLSGMPIIIANKLLNTNLGGDWIDRTRPLTGFDYLNCFFNNPFSVGIVFSLIQYPIIILISQCNKSKVKAFSLLLLLFSSLIFYQYTIRMTLRIMQISILILFVDYNLDILKNRQINKKLK